MSELNKKEIFLLEEYKSAIELTFQVDSLRNKLTAFFISISGVAIAGLLLLLKKEDTEDIGNINEIISILMFLVALIGHLFICVLAKIRKVQLEYFAIINNIRRYFYEKDYQFWNISQLSSKTLPKPSFFSGTYFWLLIIQILNVTILFIGIILLNDLLANMISSKGLLVFIGTFVCSITIQNFAYFLFSKPPKLHEYSENNSPF